MSKVAASMAAPPRAMPQLSCSATDHHIRNIGATAKQRRQESDWTAPELLGPRIRKGGRGSSSTPVRIWESGVSARQAVDCGLQVVRNCGMGESNGLSDAACYSWTLEQQIQVSQACLLRGVTGTSVLAFLDQMFPINELAAGKLERNRD